MSNHVEETLRAEKELLRLLLLFLHWLLGCDHNRGKLERARKKLRLGRSSGTDSSTDGRC